MLYVSTRNTTDTYTAYRALQETQAPDGGFYAPFYLPVFTDSELIKLRSQSCCETVAQLLNMFFGLHLQAWDVECAIGKNPFQFAVMQHKLTVVESWRNPDRSYHYLLRSLYMLMTEEKSAGRLPAGWARIAIEIALLFGLYSAMDSSVGGFDISVVAGDFSEITAISYGKDMGLPVNLIICTCNDGDLLWELLNRGECGVSYFKSTADQLNYFEAFLYKCLGVEGACEFLAACEFKTPYRIDEAMQSLLCKRIYAAVVSVDRVGTVAANMYRTNGHRIDGETARAYGGLQDYRSASGASVETLILSKEQPNIF